MADTDSIQVRDKSNDRKYFTITPRLVWALVDNPYELGVWVIVKDIAGDAGTCILGVRQIAALCMASIGKTTDCIKSLIDKELISGSVYRDPGYPQPVWHLTIPDLWQQNTDWCLTHPTIADRIAFKEWQKSVHHMNTPENAKERSPHEQGVSPHEQGVSPHERKNNIKKNHKEENTDIWNQILRTLKDQQGPAFTNGKGHLLDSMQLLEIQRHDNDNPWVLRISAPDPDTQVWAQEHIGRTMGRIARGVLLHPAEVIFESCKENVIDF